MKSKTIITDEEKMQKLQWDINCMVTSVMGQLMDAADFLYDALCLDGARFVGNQLIYGNDTVDVHDTRAVMTLLEQHGFSCQPDGIYENIWGFILDQLEVA